MSLSGSVVNQAVTARPVRTSFGRSVSYEDLASAASDAIQMYISPASRQPPLRMFPSESIRSVNVKIRGPGKGFYSNANQKCIVSGSTWTGAESVCTEVPSASAQSMQFVLGLSDLLFISVATFSGQEYVFSVEKSARPSVRDLKLRISERDGQPVDEMQLVRTEAGTPLSDDDLVQDLDSPGFTHLHLFVRRSSKVHARAGPGGRTLELTVHSAPHFEVQRCQSAFELSTPSELSSVDENCELSIENEVLGLPPSNGSTPASEYLPDSTPSHSVFEDLVERVRDGLAAGHSPQLAEEGTGGTYFMSDSSGRRIAVFKPMDEEPLAMNCPRGMAPSVSGEGLKKGTKVGEGAFREVAAYVLDHHPQVLKSSEKPVADAAREGFAGVPRTVLARCSQSAFVNLHDGIMTNGLAGYLDAATMSGASKLGSLQEFVPAVSNCEDMGPSRFPVAEVHKIAVLDMRLANADRNGANILVQATGGSSNDVKLVPIDHGYCLPESMEDCTFEWLYWPQAKASFDRTTLEYIACLDAEADIALLSSLGWNMSEAAARVFLTSTALLRKGAAAGLTPYDIGNMMVRGNFDRPSVAEEIMEETLARMDQKDLVGVSAFSSMLSDVIDEFLASQEPKRASF